MKYLLLGSTNNLNTNFKDVSDSLKRNFHSVNRSLSEPQKYLTAEYIDTDDDYEDDDEDDMNFNKTKSHSSGNISFSNTVSVQGKSEMSKLNSDDVFKTANSESFPVDNLNNTIDSLKKEDINSDNEA